MVNLLNGAQLLQIRSAIKDVTDTFARTPVTLHKITAIHDIAQETRNKVEVTDYLVEALVVYKQQEMQKTNEGSVDYNECKLTLNIDDMLELGIVEQRIDETVLCVLETEKDYFTVKGLLYSITSVTTVGPLEPKEVLLTITGELSQTQLISP